MALTILYEWWSGADHYAAADVLQDFDSGSIAGMVSGLFDATDGQAIDTPTNLRKSPGTGPSGTDVGAPQTTSLIAHLRAQYNADGIPLRLLNSSSNGPYVQVIAGVVTVHRNDGTLLGTSSVSWPAGTKRTLSVAFTLANSATGRVKLWINSALGLDLSSVQTIDTGGANGAQGCEYHGFGVFDDFGIIKGSTGAFVDADVPLEKWCRTKRASASGTGQDFTPQGTGSTHLDRVNETLANGDTNSVDSSVQFQVEGFRNGSLPANVGTVWGIEQLVQARQNGGSLVRSLRLRTADGGGSHGAGDQALALTFTMPRRHWRTNPNTAVAWSTEYSTTDFEVLVFT